MLSTLQSNRHTVLSLLLLVIGFLSATFAYRTSANNPKRNTTQSGRVPLTVLQSSEPPIRSDYARKTLLAPSKDGRSLYALDAVTGELIVHERNGKPPRKVADSFLNVEAFAVGHKHELYLAHSDSTVRIVGSDGRRLNAFRTVYPRSVAVLANGNVVVASPFNGKNLHLYNGKGVLLTSFGDIRPFDASHTENEFLNEGRVVVGPGDQIYYVSTYAPEPYVLRFSSEGQLLGEFPIEGEAVDLQTDLAREFLSGRGICNGGVTIITSASVNPETGHLWLGMNGMSTQGTVYEYDQTGTKLREFALLLDSNNKRENVTHVKDIAVSGDSLSILTWGGTYGFKLSEVLIADAWKVPTKTSKPTGGAWANPFAGITKFWESAPVIRPGIPQPVQGSCPPAQVFTCTANCPTGTLPNPADCGAQIGALFHSGQSKRVTQSSCTAQTVNSTPGAPNPGGCSQSINWCDTSTNGVTGTHTVNVNCTAVPTPTPTPAPTPTPTAGGGGCTAWWVMWCSDVDYEECRCVGTIDKTPVLIDVPGNGFSLTSAANGVNFDLDADGVAEVTAWTAPGSDDAFLVLDRNGNGAIDGGAELFGNATPQSIPPAGERTNGFLALAEYDKPSNGGNGDGVIDQRDAVYSSLHLWQDGNHNGASEANELYSLTARGLATIELDHKLSKKADQYGNEFRYRAKVKDAQGNQLGRWAWDVILAGP